MKEQHWNWQHGESHNNRTPEYVAWVCMLQRCNNPNNYGFRWYGKEGIKVCERWEFFENFLFDMGRKPSLKHTLGRIDSNGNYEPTNCTWQTRTEQLRNRPSFVVLTLNKARLIRNLYDEGYSSFDIAKMLKINPSTVNNVIYNRTWREA